jgi:hypothetical protein
MSDVPVLEYRPMFMQTEHGAIFRGGPEAAAFLVCRCGVQVKVGMERQHEDLIPHADARTQVTRG